MHAVPLAQGAARVDPLHALLRPRSHLKRRAKAGAPQTSVSLNEEYASLTRTSPPLVAPLFRSEGQASLLAVIAFGDDPIGLTDLALKAGVPRSSAYREVARLVDAGLLHVKTVGRKWQISANPSSPLMQPVRQILAVAYGPAVMLNDELNKIEGVDAALIFGSFAARASGIPGPSPKDIDLLVIGDVAIPLVCAATQPVSKVVG